MGWWWSTVTSATVLCCRVGGRRGNHWPQMTSLGGGGGSYPQLKTSPTHSQAPSCQDKWPLGRVWGGGHIPEDHRGDGTSKHAFLTARLLLRPHFRSAPSPIKLIFVPHLLLWRLFSFRAFSYGAYFCSAPYPKALNFVPPLPRLLFWRLFSFRAFSYDAKGNKKARKENGT